MKSLGYTVEHMDVLPFLRRYHPQTASASQTPSLFHAVNQQKATAP
jgi:hypothetical protein